MTASWFETRLPTILSNYELPDIYNADEFGLFFQALPSKFLYLKDEKCNAKARISNDDQLRAQNNLDDPFIELRSSIEELKERNSEEFLDDISPEEFTNLDDSVVATERVLTDELIIEIV